MRSELNPEEQPGLVDGPTTFPKGPNRFALKCAECGGSYFVDEVIYRQAVKAVAEGQENSFTCEDCQTEYDELDH